MYFYLMSNKDINCQGQEKIEEVCKDMFLILCIDFFIAYQARIT